MAWGRHCHHYRDRFAGLRRWQLQLSRGTDLATLIAPQPVALPGAAPYILQIQGNLEHRAQHWRGGCSRPVDDQGDAICARDRRAQRWSRRLSCRRELRPCRRWGRRLGTVWCRGPGYGWERQLCRYCTTLYVAQSRGVNYRCMACAKSRDSQNDRITEPLSSLITLSESQCRQCAAQWFSDSIVCISDFAQAVITGGSGGAVFDLGQAKVGALGGRFPGAGCAALSAAVIGLIGLRVGSGYRE